MSNQQTILTLLESVQPDDTAGLDEIDARVWKYLHPWSRSIDDIKADPLIEKYTRDRNALKAIRPEGWFPLVARSFDENTYRLYGYIMCCESGKIDTMPFLPTEELAELHAIIQAIAHDRAALIQAAGDR